MGKTTSTSKAIGPVALLNAAVGVYVYLGDVSGPSRAVLGVLLFALLVVVCNEASGTDPIGRTVELFEHMTRNHVGDVDDLVNRMNDMQKNHVPEERYSSAQWIANKYYDLVTLFYEWGWGQSFHFVYQYKGESFQTALRRHEWYLAGRLGVNAGDKILDVGCGIGGPMRNIAEFTLADVTGVSINNYQVQRGNYLNAKAGLASRCRLVNADFMQLPFEDNSFDGVYAIEATEHAPDRTACYREILRVLKPGAVFACYEWCYTDVHDESREDHRTLKREIEEASGLPGLASTHDCKQSMIDAGFQVLDDRDLGEDDVRGGDPWWLPLAPSPNIFSQRFQFTKVGMALTTNLLWALEQVWLVPKGTYKVQTLLLEDAVACYQGGLQRTFTPMYLLVGRKPAASE